MVRLNTLDFYKEDDTSVYAPFVSWNLLYTLEHRNDCPDTPAIDSWVTVGIELDLIGVSAHHLSS